MLTLLLCDRVVRSLGTSDSVVRLRFEPDPYLDFDAKRPRPNSTHRAHYGCPWADQAGEARAIVVSFGAWAGASDSEHAERATSTLDRIAALRAAARRPPVSESVIFRGTHAAIPGCDALRDPTPADGHDLKRFITTLNNRTGEGYQPEYGWEHFEAQNDLVRAAAAAHGAPYLDVYYATSLRPGGHRPAMGAGGKGTDCMHYCLPGPIDDWARLLMAFWT